MLHEITLYVQTFILSCKWAICNHPHQQHSMGILLNKDPSNMLRARHNGPHSSEVASTTPRNEGEIEKTHIVLSKRGVFNMNGNEVLDNFLHKNWSNDHIICIMFFPGGWDGWYKEFEQWIGPGRKVKITPLLFYSWKLETHDDEFNTILNNARPSQQYLLDHFAR